ncbi:MAG: hypothetical protein LIP77_01760, partial [Planctomycetes bacterium]|nr:hypothetical protein [Planctomycetota bacterium]
MAKTDLSQLSFNGGELAPALYGRYDLARYATGVALAENIVMRPHGGGYKRVGTSCITEALDDDKPIKLIPFRFSVVQSYMLEFGDRKMRIIKDDALVAYPPGHEREHETVVVEPPCAAQDLARLRYC